jgi:hypothetical protein
MKLEQGSMSNVSGAQKRGCCMSRTIKGKKKTDHRQKKIAIKCGGKTYHIPEKQALRLDLEVV